jgi:hypothetical protein
MITAICRQPECRQHWVLSALTSADTHEQALSIVTTAQCPTCHQPLTIEQIEAYLQCFDEVLEMDRDIDVEYWWGYMMGGRGFRGTH